MKKKLLIAAAAVVAVAAAALIVFSRTRYGWNIAKRYKAYLDYTFDGNYTLTKGKQVKDGLVKGFTYWTLEFDDGSGKMHSHLQDFTNFVGSYKENFSSAKSKNDNNVFFMVGNAAACRAKREFSENILLKYLTVYHNDEYDSWRCDEADVSVLAMPYLCMRDYKDKEVYKRLDPKNGFKFTDTGLKEFACDFDMYFIFTMQIPLGADTEKYTRIFHDVFDDFVAYTGKPLNYSFILRERVLNEEGTEVTNIIEKNYFINGEEYIRGEGESKATEALKEKYDEVYGLK